MSALPNSFVAYYKVKGHNNLQKVGVSKVDITENDYLDTVRLDVSQFINDEKLSSPILILINGGKSGI